MTDPRPALDRAQAWGQVRDALHEAAARIACPLTREQAAALAYAVVTVTTPTPTPPSDRGRARAYWADREAAGTPMTSREVAELLSVSDSRARAIVADWRRRQPTPTPTVEGPQP
jgi:hypothetical protein